MFLICSYFFDVKSRATFTKIQQRSTIFSYGLWKERNYYKTKPIKISNYVREYKEVRAYDKSFCKSIQINFLYFFEIKNIYPAWCSEVSKNALMFWIILYLFLNFFQFARLCSCKVLLINKVLLVSSILIVQMKDGKERKIAA